MLDTRDVRISNYNNDNDSDKEALQFTAKESGRSRKNRVRFEKEMLVKKNDNLKSNQSRKNAKKADEEEDNKEDNLETNLIKKMMGFSGFGSTKNKKVEGTDCYGVHKIQHNEYRQYINRKKGFNRPLSPTRGDRKARRTRKKHGRWIEKAAEKAVIKH